MSARTRSSDSRAGGKGRRRRRASPSIAALVVIVASCFLLPRGPSVTSPLTSAAAEPHPTIPRSNNRYTRYGDDDGLTLESSGLSVSDPYHPPWNPSPRIDSHGFLSERCTRCAGEWESLANIRGRHGPRCPRRHARSLSPPCRIRQVPGDGNCLFHSVAASLHRAVNGTHLPMDTRSGIRDLRRRSLELRRAAVDVLRSDRDGGRRRLHLQGDETLQARELLGAAAAQFDMGGEEYCDLMGRESYWGGGPEIVALCNHLRRPIHIYELIPADEVEPLLEPSSPSRDDFHAPASDRFALRRMACFGSPRFDRREPLHILSADSRFPDVEPRRIRRVGNHFLALFPEEVGEGEGRRLGRHALVRGGSRAGGDGSGARIGKVARDAERRPGREGDNPGKDLGAAVKGGRWDGGSGRWASSDTGR